MATSRSAQDSRCPSTSASLPQSLNVCSRRRLLQAGCAGFAAGTLLPTMLTQPLSAAVIPASTLSASPSAEQPFSRASLRRVRVGLDVTGSVHLQPGSGEKTTLPLKVSGLLDYEEQPLPSDGASSFRFVRHYYRAQADIRVGQGQTLERLEPTAQYFVVENNPDPRSAKPRFHRLDGTLTPEQSELLEVPFESAVIESLLPDGEIDTESVEAWSPQNEALASLLNLEAVTQQEVTCRWRATRGASAEIHVSGEVQGGIDGVATTIQLNGTLRYDTSERVLREARMTIREQRSIGRARPGFDVTAKVELQLSPLASSDVLDEQTLQAWDLDKELATEPLAFRSSAAGFELLLDRRWRVISDRPKVTVLRLIDQGDLIAQCNISRLQDLSTGKRVDLDEFRNDVRQAIAAQGGQILEADELSGAGKNEVLRVVASGVVSDVSMQWHYYHVTDSAGRRAALAISIESELYERFAEADRLLIETLEMTQVAARENGAEASTSQRSKESRRER